MLYVTPSPRSTAGDGYISDDLLASVECLLELHYEKLSNLIGERLQNLPHATMPKSVEHHADPKHIPKRLASWEQTSWGSEEKPGTNLKEIVFAQQPDNKIGGEKVTENGEDSRLHKPKRRRSWGLLVHEKDKSGVVCPRLKFINENWFECLSATIVMLNTIFYGVEIDYLAVNLTTETHPAFVVANYVFTLIFLTELILRVAYDCSEFFLKSECVA
jgi:hypothetical protein